MAIRAEICIFVADAFTAGPPNPTAIFLTPSLSRFCKNQQGRKVASVCFEQYDRIMDQTDRKEEDLTLKCFSYSNSKADMNSCSGTLVFEW